MVDDVTRERLAAIPDTSISGRRVARELTALIARRLPITLKLTNGQAHDGKSAEDMLGTIGPEQTLLADRAYDSDVLRRGLAARGAWANVKPVPNRKQTQVFCAFLYKKRNLVERFFNRIKHFRAVATRYDKLVENCLAGVKLASARIWMRANEVDD